MTAEIEPLVEKKAQDEVRVIRILEYRGPRDWVEQTVEASIQGRKVLGRDRNCSITAATLGNFPEILHGL